MLERIDARAFSYCDSLENVSFPPVLKTIGKDICLFKMPIEGILNKIGFSVDKIQPYTLEPKDFDACWQQAKEELKNGRLSSLQ